MQKKWDSDVKWQVSSSSEVCFAARELTRFRHHVLQAGDLDSITSDTKQGPWSWVAHDAPVNFCKYTLLAVGGFITNPSKETDHYHLHQHIENKAYMFLMLLQNVRQLIIVGLKISPHERHMTGRWLQDFLKEETEQQECSMFRELDHVQNGMGNYQPPPSYQIWQAFSDLKTVPPELTWLKMLHLPCHVL